MLILGTKENRLFCPYNNPEPKDFVVLNFERINLIYKSTNEFLFRLIYTENRSDLSALLFIYNVLVSPSAKNICDNDDDDNDIIGMD